MAVPSEFEIRFQEAAKFPTADLAFGQMIYYKDGKAAFTDENGKIIPAGLSYVYHCTGTNDNVAISNLVNNFLDAAGEFAGTTALTMKLIIDGDVGLPSTPSYGAGTSTSVYRYFNFVSNQKRGARVHIDWGNARLPAVRKSGLYYIAYIYHADGTANIYHDKLNLSITGRANENYFSGCIYGIYNASKQVYVSNSYIYCNDTSGYIGTFYVYGIHNVSGQVYVSNSFIFSGGDMGGTSDYPAHRRNNH